MFLCLLQCVSGDGLCSCVSYTRREVLACVLASLTPCVKCWSVILSLLDHMSCVGL